MSCLSLATFETLEHHHPRDRRQRRPPQNAGSDGIAGLDGNDVIAGLGGDDVICGGQGNDKVSGRIGR